MTGVAVKLMSCVVVWSAVFAGSSPNNTTNLSLTTDDVYLARTDDDHAANDMNVEATRRSFMRKPRGVSMFRIAIARTLRMHHFSLQQTTRYSSYAT